MKIRNLLALCTLLLPFTLNATVAVSIEKIWDPGTRFLVAHTRMPFLQIRVTPNTDEPLQYLRLDRTGTAEFARVFTRIVAVDGFSRVIASAEGDALSAEPFYLRFEKTVIQARNPLLLTIAGETKSPIEALSAEAGKSVSLKIGEVRLGNASEPSTFSGLDIRGAVHTVNSSLFVGAITGIYRFGGEENRSIGTGQNLGAMRFTVSSAEDISSLPSFTINTTGGTADDIHNLALVSSDGGQRISMNITDLSRSGLTAAVEPEKYVTFAKGGAIFYFRGDIGNSFGKEGGTISFATTPSAWRSTYGAAHGYEIPVTSFGTITGPTITVRGPRLDISTKAPPYAWVDADQTGLTVLTYVLDARESSEDIGVTELPFWIVTAPQWRNDVSKARFYVGNTELPGTGTLHSSASSDWSSAYSTAFFPSIIVPQGTTKEIQLKIDLAVSANGFYGFGILDLGNIRAVGVQTGLSPTINLRPGWHIIRASQRKG